MREDQNFPCPKTGTWGTLLVTKRWIAGLGGWYHPQSQLVSYRR